MGTPADSTKQTQDSCLMFREYFESRPDIGFGKLLLDVAFEGRDPFKPWEPRRWKKGFLAAMLVVCLAVAWFVYWNVLD